MAEQSGDGTLYDADDNEMSAVGYRIEHDAPEGEPVVEWGGFLTLPGDLAETALEAGRYILEFADGTRSEIDLDAVGAGSGTGGDVAFTGAGVLGAATATG